jgi:diguanylate cyclase (GGDEF)-like protein
MPGERFFNVAALTCLSIRMCCGTGITMGFFTGQHDSELLVLAMAIAAGASFVVFKVYSHLLARGEAQHGNWRFLTALCAATGIWTAHFVIALANVAEAQGYDPRIGAVSFAVAFCAALMGIGIAARPGRVMMGLGGAAIGLGIGLTHIAGMAAIQFSGNSTWDYPWLALALVPGVVLAAAAMIAFRELSELRATALGTALFALALVLTPLLAAAGFSVQPDYLVDRPATPINETMLAYIAAAITAAALTGASIAAYLDGRSTRANFSRFGELMDATIEGIVLARDGKIITVNARVLEMTGRTQADLAGQKVYGELLAARRRYAMPGTPLDFEAPLRTNGDATVPVQVVRRPLHAMAHANEVYAIRDLRERAEAEGRIAKLGHELRQRDQDLRRRNFLLDGVLNNMPQGLCMFDSEKRVVIANERYATIYRLTPEDIQPGALLQDIVQKRIDRGFYAFGSPKEYMEERLAPFFKPQNALHELGDGRVIAVTRRPMPGGGWVTTHEDITERRRIEAENRHLSQHDPLTFLPNRVSLNGLLKDTLLAATRKKRRLAIILLDIDHFREINDIMGHDAGDTLLKAVAERLRSHTRKSTLLARVGDDEFVLVESVDQPGRDATALATRIQEQLRLPFRIGDESVTLDSTIGIAISPGDGIQADILLQRASLAMRRGKKVARGSQQFFDPLMEKQVKEHLGLERDLSGALEKREFELHYQPLVNLARNEVSGFEALLRWRHPTRGLVTPPQFIHVAEEAGLMPAIGEWILRQACAEAAQWPAPLKVAINISAEQFKTPDFVRTVMGALASSGLTAQRLELEISEKVVQQDPENALTTLRQLSEPGVRIALDDFGTGFASLTYLRRFPFHRAKIDRSFVGNLADEDALVIVRTLVRLGAGFGLATTAEGVETKEQYDIVRAEGCTEMQGYYFSAPKTADEIRALFLAKAKSAVA